MSSMVAAAKPLSATARPTASSRRARCYAATTPRGRAHESRGAVAWVCQKAGRPLCTPWYITRAMDLTLSPSEQAVPRRVARLAGREPPGRGAARRRRVLRPPPRLASHPLRCRLRWLLLARGVRRPRRDADRAGALRRGAGARHAPAPANILGIVMGGPTLIAHGTDEQKDRCLGRSSPARRSGARASRSPSRAPTSPRSRRKAVKSTASGS